MQKGEGRTFSRHRFVAYVIVSSVILFTLGCNLFSVDYWVHRLDHEKTDQPTEVLATTESDQTGFNFGSKCLSSSGASPCPMEACVAYKGEYAAKYVVKTELFGKANPSDYACSADFQFTNNSGVDLMGFEHRVTEYDNGWYYQLYPKGEVSWGGSNYFTRKDGEESTGQGVTEIVVLYANPHCDWIQWDEPGLEAYRVTVEAGCFSN